MKLHYNSKQEPASKCYKRDQLFLEMMFKTDFIIMHLIKKIQHSSRCPDKTLEQQALSALSGVNFCLHSLPGDY